MLNRLQLGISLKLNDCHKLEANDQMDVEPLAVRHILETE